ncbi:MAG: hypothetical protein E7587_08985 [Ruminococcaceae bacterium]|nr:hypothetical protein [Oscillospiraceae bacterium]
MKEAKNPIKVKHENKNIVISRPYSIRAAIPNTKEYKLLSEIKSVYSDYTIVIREIKKTPKESYKGLTYSYMEYYITTHENAEARMAEYNEIRLRAECHDMKYGNIKKWFLSAYPKIDDFTPQDFETQKATA